MENLEALRYPIGHFTCPDSISKAQIVDWIQSLETFPARLQNLVMGLTEAQLSTPYRPEGWTIRQLVHHIADSHHHSYIRTKWALTEDAPVIKAYDEKGWSLLFDAQTAPISLSLHHLTAVHAKLVFLLKGLSDAQFEQYYIHAANNSKVSVAENIGKYVWHGNHHYVHIKNAVVRNQW